MRTVSDIVQTTLQDNPFLAEILTEGLANNAEVARRIKPQVEKALYEEVSKNSIAMAIHRLTKQLQKPSFGTRYLNQLNDITVRSNLVEFIFSNEKMLPPDWYHMLRSIEKKKDSFLYFSQGLYKSIIVVNEEFEHDTARMLAEENDLNKIANLSALTLRLPKESLNVPGVYYLILKALALEGISFVEILSIDTELSIICNDGVTDKAFSVLKRMTA